MNKISFLTVSFGLMSGLSFAANFVGEAQMLKQIKFVVSTQISEKSVEGYDVQNIVNSNVSCTWNNNILRDLCNDRKDKERSILALSPIDDVNKTCSESIVTRGFVCSTSGKEFYIAYPNNNCPELGGIPTPAANTNDCSMTVKFHFLPDPKAGKFPRGYNIKANAKNDLNIHVLTALTSYLAGLSSDKELKWMSSLIKEVRQHKRIAELAPDSETVAQLWDQFKADNNFQVKGNGSEKELNLFISSAAAGDRIIRLHNIKVETTKKAFQCTNETYEIVGAGTQSKSLLNCTYSDWCNLGDLRLCTKAQYLFLKANTAVTTDSNPANMFYQTLLKAQDAGMNKMQDMVRFAGGLFYFSEERKSVINDGNQVVIQPLHMFPLASKYLLESENLLGLPEKIVLKQVNEKK